jgi:hypothetical protein
MLASPSLAPRVHDGSISGGSLRRRVTLLPFALVSVVTRISGQDPNSAAGLHC